MSGTPTTYPSGSWARGGEVTQKEGGGNTLGFASLDLGQALWHGETHSPRNEHKPQGLLQLPATPPATGGHRRAAQKQLERSCSHGFNGRKTYVLSCISSVGIAALGCTDSLAQPNVSSTACPPAAEAQAQQVPSQPGFWGPPARSPPAPQEAALTLRHRSTRPAASAALPALWGARCCRFHLLGTKTQAVRLSCSKRVTQHTKHKASARLLLWGVWPGRGTKSTTQKGKFRTVQAGFQEHQDKVHSRLLGFHLGLKLAVPDSSTQPAPALSLALTRGSGGGDAAGGRRPHSKDAQDTKGTSSTRGESKMPESRTESLPCPRLIGKL